MAKPKPVPDGFRTVTPHIVIDGAAKALDFYKKAFGAEELYRMPSPDGKKLMHASMKIGDSMIMLCDDFPEYGKARAPKKLGGSPVTIHLYVQDADAAWKRAVDAGAQVGMELQDMFWGDRYGTLTDPFGHEWAIASKNQDLTPEQVSAAAKKAFG